MLSRLPYAGDATIYTQVAFGLVAVVSRDLHQGQQWAVRDNKAVWGGTYCFPADVRIKAHLTSEIL